MASRGDWIILLTSQGRTLKLAETLAQDGFQVWAPSRKLSLRRVRWTVTRNVRVPIMPGYVFASRRHLFDMLDMERMPIKPRRGSGLGEPAHVPFRVLRSIDGQGVSMVADEHLETLREAEIPAKIRRRKTAFDEGSSVRITGGGFTGFTGVVERSNRRSAQVWLSLFGRHFRAEIPTSILKLDEAYREQSETDAAERKAA